MEPLSNPSISGDRFVFVFVDDYSKKAWVFFLKNKYRVFDHFCEWKVSVENECDKKIKSSRSDNGKEYDNNASNQFCLNHGIKQELTVLYTPHSKSYHDEDGKVYGACKKSIANVLGKSC